MFVNDPEIFDDVENMWERGTNRAKMFKGLVDKYTWVNNGSSFYPSELQAAFLLSQLQSIDENMAIREKIAKRYKENLRSLRTKGKIKMQTNDKQETWNNHAIVVIFNTQEDADEVRITLNESGFSPYIGYVPLTLPPWE